MIRELVKHSVNCLNQLPATDGLSDTMSPTTILTGKPNPNYNHLLLEFGTYVQIFEPTTFATNTLRSRTTGAITLNHTGNTQGDYHFMSLITGKRLSRHQWTVLPISDATIARVEELAAIEQQPWIQSTGLIVEWRPEFPFEDDDDDDFVYTPEVDDDTDTDTDDWYDYNDLQPDDQTVTTDNLSVDDFTDPRPPLVSDPMPTDVSTYGTNHMSNSDTDDTSTLVPGSPTTSDDALASLFNHPNGFLDSEPGSHPHLHPITTFVPLVPATTLTVLPPTWTTPKTLRAINQPVFYNTPLTRSSPPMFSPRCPPLRALNFMDNQQSTPF
jgi:hypothetical protein